ncbi:MAG: L-serine ammonia-lyase, iron-sulfur-dependent, subunit alpha, partial [Lachnospiraceae bacterium]|nr:L-serine ammonia-lyase, iron-sulfur-dependent, subunit alpha [Lachnospiraceae bacterium]
AGIIAGKSEKTLEVIADVQPEQIPLIAEYLEKTPCTITESNSGCIFDIQIRVFQNGHNAAARIAGHHTNIVYIEKDGEVLFSVDYQDSVEENSPENKDPITENFADENPADLRPANHMQDIQKADRRLLTIENIVQFANEVDLSLIHDTIARQIAYNTAIAEEGLKNTYGAQIGRILLASYGDSVQNRAKAMAAAGSDARMNGCELPVVINSGSGNQGMTTSLPVIVYAKEIGAPEELLYRALVVANLVTIHLKTGIGRLSAYCGATSAGCGAGAGITYLYGGRYREIAHTIVNAIAINSGVICDGAKASCAAKIASSVEAGLLGMQMFLHGTQFKDGDGIVTKGVENTIRNVGELAREGMKETDREIIHLMLQKMG